MRKKLEKAHRFLLWITLVALCNAAAFAQEHQYKLSGTLSMQTGETFPYMVTFSEVDGNLTGEAVTFAAPHQTVSVIRGTVDRYEKRISFKEVEITSSRSLPTKAYMCLVNAKLYYEQDYRGATLKGAVTNKQTDKTACTPGTLTFSNAADLRPLFEATEKYDTVISMKKKMPSEKTGIKVAIQDNEEPQETARITVGEEKTYKWYTDTLIIDLWDGGATDGDVVSIQLNDSMLLRNYALVKKKKTIKVYIPPTITNILTILAGNEGTDPPNTATLLLTDGSTKHPLVAYNKSGEKAIIKIKRVP